MAIGILTLHLLLRGCSSLKEKRSYVKPIIARLHREFNISVAEIDRQDMWQEAILACAIVTHEHNQARRAFQKVILFIEKNWPDLNILDHHIELL